MFRWYEQKKMIAVRKARPPIVSMMPPRALLCPPTQECVLNTINCITGNQHVYH